MTKEIIEELKAFSSFERKKANEWFFKTGPGDYGEGDVFMGVRVPDVRKVAKRYIDIAKSEIAHLLESEVHEVRLCALLILVERHKQAVKSGDKKAQKEIFDFYLKYLRRVNNWDLVDLSAPYIIGEGIHNDITPQETLDMLSRSENMWERRIAMVGTWALTRAGNIDPALRIAKKLLSNKEDLMHKAVGWMLREVWKKDPDTTEAFLREYYQKMPRTTLRYAIERVEEGKRKRILKGYFD